MRKLGCNICDGCRAVLSLPWHKVQGKKRQLDLCAKCFKERKK